MRAHTPDATRQNLLKAAFDEIYRVGFQAASLSEIVRHSGLTKGALYHHFPNKHALGLAVIDEVIQERLATAVFQPLQNAQDPLAALLQILEDRARTRDEDTIRCGCPLNNLVQEMSPVDHEFRHHLAAILARWQTVLHEALSGAQRQGTLRADVDCEGAALFMVAAWEGCWGIAKNRQSAGVFRQCMWQLRDYVRTLSRPAPSDTKTSTRRTSS